MKESPTLTGQTTTGAEACSAESTVVEQRRHRRISTTLDVRISWQDEFGLQCHAFAVVRDVSAGGFGIELDRQPPLGSLLTVRTLKSSMQCVVRHVQPQQDTFLVGVEMLPAPDGTTPTQSLERLAASLSAARKASLKARSDVAGNQPNGVAST